MKACCLLVKLWQERAGGTGDMYVVRFRRDLPPVEYENSQKQLEGFDIEISSKRSPKRKTLISKLVEYTR